MRVWIIPMIYVAAAFAFGQVLPRFEVAYIAQDLMLGISVSSAQDFRRNFTISANMLMAFLALLSVFMSQRTNGSPTIKLINQS